MTSATMRSWGPSTTGAGVVMVMVVANAAVALLDGKKVTVTKSARRRRTSCEARRPPLASGKGVPVSHREVLEHLVIEGKICHQGLQPLVLILKLLLPLGFLALHPAVLGPPALKRRLAHLQGLQHCSEILTCVEHRISVTQLGNNLFWTVLLPSSRHRKSPCPQGSGPSYRLDQDFQGRPVSTARRMRAAAETLAMNLIDP